MTTPPATPTGDRPAALGGDAARFAARAADMPAACFLVDASGRYRWVNGRYAGLAGPGPTALIGVAPERLPTEAAALAARSATALGSGVPHRVRRFRFPRQDGPPRWVTGMAFPLASADEVLVGGLFFELGRDADIGVELGWLLDQTPIQLLCTDTDLRYTWSAGSWARQFVPSGSGIGLSAYEILGTTDPAHPGIAPLLEALRGRVVSYHLAFRGRRVDSWVGPLRDGDGHVVGTVAAVIDVTDSEQARQGEQLAVERLRRLVEHSPALIAIRDGDGQVAHANPAFLRTFGQLLADGAGDQDGNLPAGEAAELAEVGRMVRETEQAQVWQGRLPRPGGDLVDLLGHVFPFPLAGGSIGVGEVFLDVSVQERTRRQLVETEQRYRALFDGADIGVLILDLNGMILQANQAATRLAGRTLSELRHQFAGLVTTEADISSHRPQWTDLVAGRRGRYDSAFTLRRADGRTIPARSTMILVRDPAGEPACTVALMTPLAAVQDSLHVPARSTPTAAEAAVLERLAAGLSLQQIGAELGVTRRGVDYRIARLRHKLRADGPDGAPASSAALVARAYALGILLPATWPPRVAEYPDS